MRSWGPVASGPRALGGEISQIYLDENDQGGLAANSHDRDLMYLKDRELTRQVSPSTVPPLRLQCIFPQ